MRTVKVTDRNSPCIEGSHTQWTSEADTWAVNMHLSFPCTASALVQPHLADKMISPVKQVELVE